jgi:hypothetical protein
MVTLYSIHNWRLLSEEIRTKAIPTDHEAFVKAEAEVKERLTINVEY